MAVILQTISEYGFSAQLVYVYLIDQKSALDRIMSRHWIRDQPLTELITIHFTDTHIRQQAMGHLWQQSVHGFMHETSDFYYSIITFSYTKYFVDTYTADVVFTLSYQSYLMGKDHWYANFERATEHSKAYSPYLFFFLQLPFEWVLR